MGSKFKRRITDCWNSPMLFSLGLSLCTWIIFMCTNPRLSGAGDANISEFLSSSGKIRAGFFFISPALAGVLRAFNYIFLANWWSIFSIFTMFIGLYTFLWFLNKRLIKYDWIIRMLASFLFVLFFWELLLRWDINFTQTAVIASLTGVCLIVDWCFFKSISMKQNIQIVIGVILLLLGGEIRWKALVLTIPFAIMILVYMLIFPYSADSILKSLKNSLKNKKHILIMIAIIVIIPISSYALHKLYGIYNPEIGEYVRANELREDIGDYLGRYPSYEDNAEIYEQSEINKSWINMAIRFYTSDTNYFSSRDLQKMVDLRGKTDKTAIEFLMSLKGHNILWLSLFCIFIGIFALRGWKNSFFPLMGCVSAWFLFTLFFVEIGRFEWHVTNGCILAGVFSFIVMSFYPISAGKSIKMNLSISRYICLFTLMSIIGVLAVEEKGLKKPIARVYSQEQADLLDYINNNNDIVYLYQESIRFSGTYNLWATHSTDYLDNYFPLTAHFIMGCSDKLEEYGIYDLYYDLVDRSNVQIMYSDRMTTVLLDYLHDYYDPFISISAVDEFNGAYFLRYSKQIVPGGV